MPGTRRRGAARSKSSKPLGAIYARYSDGPAQTDQSIEGQVADCQAFAESKGIQIIEIYADRHVSGTSLDGRHEFKRMMHDAESGAFDYVITWKIDRFGRNREDIALGKMRLRKAGVNLLYAKESVPEGPEGIILESVLEGLAEYYSADLRQKITRGIRETAKKGLHNGSPLPIGYKTDSERRIVIDEEKAAVVREAFRMHINGATMPELIKLFADYGIVGQRGGKIGQGVIYRMLRNERYLGRFEVQGIEIPVEPIIDEATFLEAANHFKTSRNNAAGRAKVKYLLSLKCYCAYCGEMLVANTGTGKNGTKYHYYKCGGRRRGNGCEFEPLVRDEFEDKIIEATMKDMLQDNIIEEISQRVIEIYNSDSENSKLAFYERELAENRKKQKNILKALEDGTQSRSLTNRIAELEDEEDELALEIARLKIKKPALTAGVVKAWLSSFKDGNVDDPDFRQKLVDTFIARIEVKNDEALIFYNVTDKGAHEGVRVRPVWWSRRESNPRPKMRPPKLLRAQ